MYHKTLYSYFRNEPVEELQQHPNGPLWLATKEELMGLPEGVELESVGGYKFVTKKFFVLLELDLEEAGVLTSAVGIRGYKDD
jgi:hypothetical protein